MRRTIACRVRTLANTAADQTPSVHTSVNAARKSACATCKLDTHARPTSVAVCPRGTVGSRFCDRAEYMRRYFRGGGSELLEKYCTYAQEKSARADGGWSCHIRFRRRWVSGPLLR